MKNLDKRIKIIILNVNRAREAFVKIFKIIWKNKPDIVFSFIIGFLIVFYIPVFRIFQKKIKFIYRESNLPSFQNKVEKHPFIFDLIYKYLFNMFDQIIAQSNFMKRDLVENYKIKNNKVTVIHNPIILKEYKKINLFNHSFINIVLIGRLHKQKRIDRAILVLSKLPNNFILHIVGDGEEKKDLIKLSDKLNIQNRIKFWGWQDNPYQFINEADLLILTSAFAGFPNVLLEAGILGIPVVAFDCPQNGPISEIIVDGVNGFLVECNNIEELKKTILKASSIKWDKEKIIKLTKDRFDVEKIVKEYERLFTND